jgi:hypothetical protein
MFHTYGQTQTDGRRDMMKLIIAFRNLAKQPEKAVKSPH